jgi:hypothetical protein
MIFEFYVKRTPEPPGKAKYSIFVNTKNKIDG